LLNIDIQYYIMGFKKSYEEINEKIRKGKAVVLTAEEVSAMARELSPSEIVKRVDVVTTATFGAMCSSGAILNFGHTTPPMRMERITLNGVPCHGGLAAVDTYIGATSENPENIKYGGAHIIQELVEGKSVELEAWGKGTDCYPRKYIKTKISLETINEATLFNPRNAYQNYNVATNTTSKIKYTYMGTLLPGMKNANYSTAGELSPLLNDPDMRTIGIGTRIFLGGTVGYVVWPGTQFNTSKEKNRLGIPMSNAATIAVIGNLKEMSAEFLRAAYYEKYGVSLFVGIGVPIPILDEEIASRVSIRNEHIETTILDYGTAGSPVLGRTNYAELQSGVIEINGKKIRTAPVASLQKAREIADLLKKSIQNGKFELTAPVAMFPTGTSLKKLFESEGGEK
jgi:L-aspartate semialdehyde sulfurtransferase